MRVNVNLMKHNARFLVPVLAIGLLAGCGPSTPITPQQRLSSATDKLAMAKTDQERFYALDDAAKQSFVLGKTEDARNYASNLLALLPKFPNDWNYGNAVQDGNLVLGRIAVQEGRMEDAKRY